MLAYKRTSQILAVRKQVTVITEHLVRASETKMNFSQSSRIGNKSECKNLLFKTATLQYSSADSFYGLLVAAAVLNLAACPFTIFLNALVMVAVKAKQGLQTHPNILLACLALTDLMVGLVVQPFHTTMALFQEKDSHTFCDIHFAFSISFVIFTFATTSHLILISGERYLAIKHTFTHATVVTKKRLMISSVLVWITAPLYCLAASHSAVARFVYIAALISSIVLFQVLVYKEARRHEKLILSQQVSVEARAKFKQEKKASKLTTVIIAKTLLCFLFPTISVIITFTLFRDQFSPDLKILIAYLCRLLVISSSVLNPVIYTVRKREFRVAYIEFLLRKSLQDAEEFDRKLFGSTANAVRPQNGKEGEAKEQHNEERNAAHANDNLEDNLEVFAFGSNHDENSFPLQNETFSSNTLTDLSESTHGHSKKRNPIQDKNDDRDLLGPGSSVGRKGIDIAWNENSNEQNNDRSISL